MLEKLEQNPQSLIKSFNDISPESLSPLTSGERLMVMLSFARSRDDLGKESRTYSNDQLADIFDCSTGRVEEVLSSMEPKKNFFWPKPSELPPFPIYGRLGITEEDISSRRITPKLPVGNGFHPNGHAPSANGNGLHSNGHTTPESGLRLPVNEPRPPDAKKDPGLTEGRPERLGIKPAEKAFMRGLLMSRNFDVRYNEGSKKIVVSTESRNEDRETFALPILKHYGEQGVQSRGFKVNLPSPDFDFTINSRISPSALMYKSELAPFLAGLLVGNLTSDGSVSLEDGNLLGQLLDSFSYYFNFKMGPSVTMREGKTPVIRRIHSEKVINSLLEVPEVANLPYADTIKKFADSRRK
ncbi:MAG TPA: hypothetical protein VHE53_04290 [Patescibacteria group bacterium]|nr:hypothetical protein [Patescibacteria group bacterium]